MEKYTPKHQLGDKVFVVLEPVGKSLTHPIKEVTISEVKVTEREHYIYRGDTQVRITESFCGYYLENYDRKDINLDWFDWFDTKEEAQTKQTELREELKAERQQELEHEAKAKKDEIQKQYDDVKAEAKRLGIELK